MVHREFIQSGTLLKYTLTNVSRASLEQWATLVKEDTNSWDSDQAYPALHDFCAIQALTLALRHYTTEVSLNAAQRQLPGVFVAVLLKPGLGFKLANAYLTRELSRLDKNVHFQAFQSDDRALAWLQENMTAISLPK